jgi:hypothetical protein
MIKEERKKEERKKYWRRSFGERKKEGDFQIPIWSTLGKVKLRPFILGLHKLDHIIVSFNTTYMRNRLHDFTILNMFLSWQL